MIEKLTRKRIFESSFLSFYAEATVMVFGLLYVGMRLQFYYEASTWFVWVAAVVILTHWLFSIKSWIRKESKKLENE